jgi:hypothetical protein
VRHSQGPVHGLAESCGRQCSQSRNTRYEEGMWKPNALEQPPVLKTEGASLPMPFTPGLSRPASLCGRDRRRPCTPMKTLPPCLTAPRTRPWAVLAMGAREPARALALVVKLAGTATVPAANETLVRKDRRFMPALVPSYRVCCILSEVLFASFDSIAVY